MPLLEGWGIPTRLTSLSDFEGCYRGFVTDMADEWLEAWMRDEELAKDEIFACGPTPMLKASLILPRDMMCPAGVSRRKFMACAVGGCAGCAVKIVTPDGEAMKRVCVDGPVFDAATVHTPETRVASRSRSASVTNDANFCRTW